MFCRIQFILVKVTKLEIWKRDTTSIKLLPVSLQPPVGFFVIKFHIS